MQLCPRCSAEVKSQDTHCPACGLSIGDETAATSIKPEGQDHTPTKIKSTEAGKIHTTSSDGARFVAGHVLAGRYRIIGLVGRGGMGEVYKAEDLELEQTVALKFLPTEFTKNEDLLKRFRSEVRTARQVSHPNVCRVFDIGETEGLYYITMEFIEGDDLSMLLHRIGRLPSDKAVEISRQICLGLGAIHKAGILHRDLKPSNIIIDSKGEARITDFGIAGVEADLEGEEAWVGTPAYMSPEQITGREVTKRSDIYSLGLLLYEIFTGKQAFEGASLQELRDKHTKETPNNPSEIVTGINPVVEDLIERCLKKVPDDRPDSALKVAMMLPGGNPLQVALEAGETPTPEMVAAGPSTGTSKPLVLLLFLIGFIGLHLGILVLGSRSSFMSYFPMTKSGEVLAERSQEILRNLGYENPAGAVNSEFAKDVDLPPYFEKQDDPRLWMEKTRNGQPAYIYYLFRQSPEPLFPFGTGIDVSETNPPMTEPGMVLLKTDVTGRLIEFSAVPIRKPAPDGEQVKTDWDRLFREAGLDRSSFKEIDLTWTPPEFADELAAWEGMMAGQSDVPVKIEAAGLQGKPVYFRIVPPWKEQRGTAGDTGQNDARLASVIRVVFLAVLFTALASALLLVRYNLRNRRTDLKGAAKIAGVLFVAYVIRAVLETSLPFTAPGIFTTFFYSTAWGLFSVFYVVVFYLAVEPLVRKRWPEILISWNRLIAGGFSDPLVGSDLLKGLFFGAAATLMIVGWEYLRLEAGETSAAFTWFFNPRFFAVGPADSVAVLLRETSANIVFSFGALLLFLLIAFIFRNKWMAAVAAAFVFLIPWLLGYLFGAADSTALAGASALFYPLVFFLVLVRYGIVAVLGVEHIELIANNFVVTDPSRIGFSVSLAVALIPVALAIYAFHISRAGRPLFTGDVLKEFR